MIQQEQAKKFIESKKLETPKNIELSNYSSAYQILAKIIIRDIEMFKGGKDTPYDSSHTTKISLQQYIGAFSKYNRNPFRTEEGKKLAIFLFEETVGRNIEMVWNLINQQPYQDSYYKRSFRAKPNKTYLLKKLKYLQDLHDCRYDKNNNGFFNMDIKEIVQYSVYKDISYFSLIIASELQHNNTELQALIVDIFNGEDDIGGVTRTITTAMLQNNMVANWKEVGKLLLAAQRQEGLRQSILESLDLTSVGALKYIIKLILENDLFRFSSVIRAIDVWFGFAWESPKKATIKRVLQLADSLFDNPETIEQALQSKDNLEIYVALWVNAVINDVDHSNWKAIEIIKNRSYEKKVLAFLFIRETERSHTSLLEWVLENFGKEDVLLDYLMLKCLLKFEMDLTLFDKIKQIADKVPNKGLSFSGNVFSWTNFKITKEDFYNFLLDSTNPIILKKLGENISLIPSEKRADYIKKLFPKHYLWSLSSTTDKDKPKALNLERSDWKIKVLHQAVTDRNESVMATGLNVLNAMQLYDQEIELVTKLLGRKNASLRKTLLLLLLKQDKVVLHQTITDLLISKNVEQRLAGLELLTLLEEQNTSTNFVNAQIELFKQKGKFTKNETVYLQKFSGIKNEHNFENGFGIIDYNSLKSIYKPVDKLQQKLGVFNKLLLKINQKSLYSNFVNTQKITKAVNALIAIYTQNANYEYTYEYYSGKKITTLLAKDLRHTRHIEKMETISKEEYFDLLPLAEQWKDWYHNCELNEYELFMAIDATKSKYEVQGKIKNFHAKYSFNIKEINLKKPDYDWHGSARKVNKILTEIFFTFCDIDLISNFILDIAETMIVDFPKTLKQEGFKTISWSKDHVYWSEFLLQIVPGNHSIDELIQKSSIETKLRHWKLTMYLYYISLSKNKFASIHETVQQNPEKIEISTPSAYLTLELYQQQELNTHDLLYQYLVNDEIFRVFEGLNRSRTNEKLPTTTYKQLKEIFLEIELARGDMETEVSDYVSRFSKIKGSRYFLQALSLLGKNVLHRSFYYDSKYNRKEILSRIIKKSCPDEQDTLEQFLTDAKATKISKKRWLEVALYAPQWATWIGELLSLNKLEEAVWWFHAHASDYMNEEKETIISRYTNIDKYDLAQGSLDIDWFYQVYLEIGKTNWSTLNEAAKYISDGNGHRLIKLYSSVILGEIKITQTLEKIKTKRDKDYVKALGLVPLSKAIPKKDVLKRYNLLQVFLKESKQFGSQRQESEKIAVTIAMDNLSRTAGYSDNIRFSLAMEAQSTQQILDKATVTFADAIIKLTIDSSGKAVILVEKNGKTQKSIPAKYKNHKDIKELQSGRNYLKKQYARTRKFLEDAMVKEDIFYVEDIKKLMLHPVVKPLLSKLVLFFTTKKKAGFLVENFFIDIDGNNILITENDSCVIAHPSHLYDLTEWDLYQKHAFDTKLVQPFKQIFRELYLITKDEKEKGTLSERYQGHQIQPQKTIALLRSKGWTVSHEEGLQKVFHKKNYIATMYAMADWFSPSDIESPTLEHISFESRNNYKTLPLITIDKVTFSEVMRDIDLVVSVAHVGGVDPEASHSTLEMRAVLVKETARLFKYTNIEVKERHIIIQGKLATYSIHLGSAVISKNGLSLSIIPVHSQHRGRMFLPFVDDDPKLAEIISKMKLLAEDDKIKDSTILAQINK
ncbi:MAG: DUF4132 domain-containing protein [Flavobacteriaceae bacterium]|nr:DUF4132 domain-containing protein [Flavobacteriaceae bacterium]